MRRAFALAAVSLALVGATAAGAAPTSGIRGRIVEGPTCPVESNPPQPGCAPRPILATLRIHALRGRRIHIARSDGQGVFGLRLPPGTYVVVAQGTGASPFPRPPAPFDVSVHAGHFTTVTVRYDTGIR